MFVPFPEKFLDKYGTRSKISLIRTILPLYGE